MGRKVTCADHNTGFWVHCHNVNCDHPKWYWYQKFKLRSYRYEQQDQQRCLEVALNPLTSSGAPSVYNLKVYSCESQKKAQRFGYCPDSNGGGTLETRALGAQKRHCIKKKHRRRTPPSHYCVTRNQVIDQNVHIQWQYIANGSDWNEDEEIVLGVSVEQGPGDCVGLLK